MAGKKAHLSGEHFTHRSVWHAGYYLEKLGRENEDGGWNATLAAMLFTYLAVESYLNFVGERLFPHVWRDEREFFNSGQYRGTLGKLDFLLEQAGLAVDRGRAPYQTLKELDGRRQALVHPRPERIDRAVTYSDPSELHLEFDFHKLVDEPFVARCRRDVEDLCDLLHQAFEKRSGDQLWGARAFVGIMGHQGGWLES